MTERRNLLSGGMLGGLAAMPRALYPISGALRPELDQRLRNFLATSIGYYAHNGIIQGALNDMYAFRGVDINKVESVVDH